MNWGAWAVALVSAAVMVVPFAMAVQSAKSRHPTDRGYVGVWLGVGVGGALWIGLTAAAFIRELGGLFR